MNRLIFIIMVFTCNVCVAQKGLNISMAYNPAANGIKGQAVPTSYFDIAFMSTRKYIPFIMRVNAGNINDVDQNIKYNQQYFYFKPGVYLNLGNTDKRRWYLAFNYLFCRSKHTVSGKFTDILGTTKMHSFYSTPTWMRACEVELGTTWYFGKMMFMHAGLGVGFKLTNTNLLGRYNKPNTFTPGAGYDTQIKSEFLPSDRIYGNGYLGIGINL